MNLYQAYGKARFVALGGPAHGCVKKKMEGVHTPTRGTYRRCLTGTVQYLVLNDKGQVPRVE